MKRNDIAGLILSGGKSSRMGGIPKALCYLNAKETFLSSQIKRMKEAGLSQIFLVVGAHQREIISYLKDTGLFFQVEILENPDWKKGMLSSLLVFFSKERESIFSGVLMNLIDFPLVKKETYQKLISVASESKILIPIYQGKKGHPVFWGKNFWSQFFEIPLNKGPREVNYLNKDKIELIDVDDKGVVININTPSDYHEFLGKDLKYYGHQITGNY